MKRHTAIAYLKNELSRKFARQRERERIKKPLKINTLDLRHEVFEFNLFLFSLNIIKGTLDKSNETDDVFRLWLKIKLTHRSVGFHFLNVTPRRLPLFLSN